MSESRQRIVAIVMLMLAVPIGAWGLVSCSADPASRSTASTDPSTEATGSDSLGRAASNTTPESLVSPAAPALVGDPIAEEIAEALRRFALRLDDLAPLEELDVEIPFTGVSPSDALQLGELFEGTLGEALDGSFTNLGALRDAIDQADDPDFLGLGIDVQFTDVTIEPLSGDPPPIVVSFDVIASREVTLPIRFADETERIDFDGGGMELEVALTSTTLTFELDTTVTDPEARFYLTALPGITVTADATGPITPFEELVGFADVTVDGTATLDVDVSVDFLDPDSDGRLTSGEWEATALADLVQVHFEEEAGPEVQIALNLNSELIGAPSSTDGTIELTDENLTDGLNAPTVTLDDLDDFTNIDPTQAFAGLSLLGTAIGGAQQATDVQLPFLKETLGDTFQFAEPLNDFLRQQSEAAITCGTIDDDPPTGRVVNLSAGDEFFCQAITADVPVAVEWVTTTSNVTVVDLGTNSATVGPNPTANVKLQMTADGRPDVKLDFDDASGTPRHVSRRFLSAEELLDKLVDLGGFDPTETSTTYDPATKSLAYHLYASFDVPAPLGAELDFGDRLKAATGLSGLAATARPSATVAPYDIALNLTYGVILVENLADITPEDEDPPEDLDRFFVQVDPDPDGHELQADANIAADIRLSGRVGLLTVDVQEDPSAPFEIVTTGGPALAVDITPAGIIHIDGTPGIDDAILIGDLLRGLGLNVALRSDPVAAQVNLGVTGGLLVTADLGGPTAAQGKVTIDWPDVAAGSPQVTVDSDFEANLKRFDTDPSIFGDCDDVSTSGTSMTDNDGDFSSRRCAGGPKDGESCTDDAYCAPGECRYDALGRTLRNLTDGSNSVVTDVPNPQTLVCAGLEGGADNQWETDDEYELVGNPADLLSVILDNLDLFARRIDGLNSTTSRNRAGLPALDDNLPLIGISPKDLLGFLTDLEAAVDKIRMGTAAAIIVCELPPGTVIDGLVLEEEDVEERRNLAGLPADIEISCWAITDQQASEEDYVTWEVVDLAGTNGFISTNGLPETVGPPADQHASEILEVPTGGTLGKDFEVRVDYTGTNGHEHYAVLPAKPLSLQGLGRAIENALGLREGALALELHDDLDGDGNPDLVIRLSFGQCTEDSDLVDDWCTAEAREVPKPGQRLNLDLSDVPLPALVGVEAEDSSLKLEYAALAQLDLAVPLHTQLDPAEVMALRSSKVEVATAVDAALLGLGANIGPAEFSVAGTAEVWAKMTLDNPGIDPIPVREFVDGLDAQLSGPDSPRECNTSGVSGDACAVLTLVGSGDSDPTIELVADINTNSTWDVNVTTSSDLGDVLDAEELDWNLLLKPFEYLDRQLTSILAGGGPQLVLPIVGSRLDGGAGVSERMGDVLKDAGLAGLAGDLTGLTEPTAIGDRIRDKFHEALTDRGLLLDLNAPAGVDLGDVEVSVLCDAVAEVACTDGNEVIEIEDVRIKFLMGQETGASCDECLSFDLGIPGVPLGIDGSLEASAEWSLLVDFGLSREDGPYLVASGDGHGDEAELSASATVSLGPGTTPCSAVGVGYPEGAPFSEYNDQCLTGTLAFLQVELSDHETEPTGLTLKTSLDVTSENGERIGFGELTAGQAGLNLKLEVTPNADLRFRAATTGTDAVLPAVVGTFDLDWVLADIELDTSTGSRYEFKSEPEISFGNLYLDVGEFFTSFVRPMVGEVATAIKPFKPVVDTIRTPLPLISQLSQMTGGPPVTLLTLLELRNGGPLPMLDRIIALIDLINLLDGQTSQMNVFIPLGAGRSSGSFSVDGSQALKGPSTPDKAGRLVKEANSKTSLLDDIVETELEVSGRGLSFPFLQDSGQIFAMLLGQDVTLMRYDLGSMRATATLGPFTYCCIPIGPIPVGVYIGGSTTLSGRFAMGYDTVGLRQTFAGEGVAELLDGVFIDDLDANGVDVPEISLIGEVRAGAGVDLGLVAAGVDGGVRMTVDLNLDDRPDPDGKLRLDEIAEKMSNPICLFEVSGRLDAFLGAWVRIGFGWFSKTWRFDIVNITLLEFSAACQPPSPNPSDVEGVNCHVNIGPRASKRRFNLSEIDEEVVVRQLDTDADGNTKLSVSLMGFEDECNIPPNGLIVIKGDSGNDVISLEPGVLRLDTKDACIAQGGELLGTCSISKKPCTSDTDCRGGSDVCDIPDTDVECIIPFTRAAEIHGGEGNDRISSGGGEDYLYGDGGNDKISGGAGNDTICGGGGQDILSGDAGTDFVYGEADNDLITGGPGEDYVDGGDGDDDLNGGPGASNARGDWRSSDGSDTVIGGPGNDALQGGDGDDWLYGDEDALTCVEDGALSGGDDKIDGGPGADHLFGGAGDDVLGGQEGEDWLCGNGGSDRLDGDDLDADTADSDDHLFGGSGNDQLFGRGGHDELFGNADNDALYGGEDSDDLIGGPGCDALFGDAGSDILLGDSGSIAADHDPAHACESYPDCDILDDITPTNDSALGDIVDHCEVTLDFEDQPFLIGEGNSDCLFGGDDNDLIFGEGGHDRMFGDGAEGQADQTRRQTHRDYMEGNSGNDVMRGGKGDDYMQGNEGDDTMYGDIGQDDMIGGSILPGQPDDVADPRDPDNTKNDTMYGNQGQDVMVGDNALITRPLDTNGSWMINSGDGTVIRVVTHHDLPCDPDSGFWGNDTVYGNAGNDDMYGACGDDTMRGNEGDDYLEGNDGVDEMYGGLGQDDLIGGTGRTVTNDNSTAVDGRADGGDHIYGGNNGADLAEDYDVLVGDNATIDRPFGGDGMWQINTFNNAVIRDIRLLDVGTIESPADPEASGTDYLFGEGNDDLIFGQGGDDFLYGGSGVDYLEGNDGVDEMYGEAGGDDLIGGGSANDGVISPVSVGNGLLDGDDMMRGGDEGDVLCGDNARINRPLDTNGSWMIEPNSGAPVREVALFDVELLGGSTDPRTSGSDTMFGGDGRDLMFGQGNTQVDDDGDARFNEDPADGMDNDRDGQEGADSVGYDCLDGVDNDGDGFADADDPECLAAIDEDGGGDEMHGGAGADYMEGNHGADWMLGDDGEDDMIGGNSAGDGVIGGSVPPTDLPDGHDVMSGGAEDDVLLADNGLIGRPVDESGLWLRHSGYSFDLAVRETTMAQSPESPGAFGDDFMQGGPGEDDLYGQLGNDYIEGNDGEDAMVGDLGKITNTVEDGSRERLISAPGPFLEATVFAAGTMHRSAELYSFRTDDGAEGQDIMLGGDGRDSLHGCAGADIMNGEGDPVGPDDPIPATDDEDHLFGGDGADVIWGGRGHDHLWGGHGDDHLDVRPRSVSPNTVADPPEWFTYGEPNNYQGLDIIYGGWDRDALQADVAAPGPGDADRLIDWTGGYNVFYVCPGAYGEGTITRQGNPALRLFLQDLAESDGAFLPHTNDTCGFHDVGYVFPKDRRHNSHPPHPDHPGHFVCDDGTVRVVEE